jgi:oligopeptidase B
MMDPSLPLTTTEQLEWGNPIEDNYIRALIKAYSPVENLSAETLKSTDIWITAGLEDERVPLWQSLKYTQKLRQLSTDTHGKLVLYLSDRAHTHTPQINSEIHELSLELSFLLHSLSN